MPHISAAPLVDNRVRTAGVYLVAGSVAFVFSVAIAAMTVSSWFRADSSSSGSGPVAGLDGQIPSMLGWIAAFLVVPIGAAIIPLRRAMGVTLPGPHRWARFVQAGAVALTIEVAVSLVADRFAQDTRSDVGQMWRSNSTIARAVASAEAGITEEVQNLVVPAILVVCAVVAVIVYRQAGLDESLSDIVGSRHIWRICITACGFGLITRFTGHLYQGTTYALAAVVWGAGFIAVYAIYRSVWPIMAAHFIYDFGVSGGAVSMPREYLIAVCVGVAVATALWMWWRSDSEGPRLRRRPSGP